MTPILLFDAPQAPIDRKEILRYAGVRGEALEIEKLLDDCLLEIDGKLLSRVCYCELPIHKSGNEIHMGNMKFQSSHLSAHLKGCNRAIVFATTIGIQIDRLLVKYSRISPAKALMLQAIGAERIEAVCDAFCQEIASKHALTSRFSPGYGDLPLDIQTEIFSLLQCQKHLGLTLNESLLMSPTKSVTAIIGIKQSKTSSIWRKA